uniref:EF-hand domain-containing protein n=1 Tax=Haptolina ericina TaxID=156174 RepID=A0A7S3AN50_9EUKA
MVEGAAREARVEDREAEEERIHDVFLRYEQDGCGTIAVKHLHPLLIDLSLPLASSQYEQYIAMLMGSQGAHPSGSLVWLDFLSFYRKCLTSEQTRRRFAERMRCGTEQVLLMYEASSGALKIHLVS